MVLELGNTQIAYTMLPAIGGQLGQLLPDSGGDLWRVCKASVDLLFGNVIKQEPETVTGTVTSTQAIGTKQLKDTGNFSAILTADWLGAWGQTLGTLLNGGGQIFSVNEVLDADTLDVHVKYYTSAAGVGRTSSTGKWEVALTASSTYDIAMPGYSIKAVQGKPAAGVCLVDGGVDASVAPYFYAKVTGLAPVLVDDSDSPILPGEWVTVAASTAGYVEGPNATVTPTATELASLVGEALTGDIGFDCLLLVDLALPRLQGVSGRVARYIHPFNAVTVV
jgi:hypothetical protein